MFDTSVTARGSLENSFPRFEKMRKARRFVLVVATLASACAVYFLVLLGVERSGRLLPGDVGSVVGREVEERGLHFEGTRSCPVDPEFAATINNTVYGHPILELKGSQVLYVSVPKCGSRTFVWISWALKEANNISDIITLPYLLKEHTPAEMKLLMDKNFLSSPPRSLFHGHIRFFPPSSSAVNPVFISIIRDPLSRHVSWYYFMRFGDADMKASELQKELSQSAAGINQTYDECVLNNKPDCAWPSYLHMNVMTFCGYEKKCDSPETALEQAKRNVDNFLFVGIMEEYEDSLRVLERLIPTMYRGTSEQYFKNKGEFTSNSKTAFKKEPSPKAAEIMRERLKYDYEFYYYVRERFHKLKKHLGIGPC